MCHTLHSRLNGAIFSLLNLPLICLLFATPAHAQCVAGTWNSPDISNMGGGLNTWPVYGQSTHFDVHWNPANPTFLSATTLNSLTTQMENIWTQYMGTVGWQEPFCNSASKDRVALFIDNQWYATGGGFNTNDMGFWMSPAAIADILTLGHEFTHSLQYNSLGLRDSAYASWFWEDHASWMAHQLQQLRGDPDCSDVLVSEPHLYYGTSRNRACSWQFLEYEKDQYGYQAINNIWNQSLQPGAPNYTQEDPLWVLARNMNWTETQLNNEFGNWALHNVNWDYINPDGSNQGAIYRAYYGPNTNNSGLDNHEWRIRTAQLDAFNLANRQFQIPSYQAPQRFGYNLVRLIPDAGATSVTVNFQGIVQYGPANTSFGSNNLEPTTIPPPDSDWRWSVVAIDVNGNSRIGALQSGSSGTLTVNVMPNDTGLYMIVVATPLSQQSIFWDQKYYTLYRYPWQATLESAYPDGYQAGFVRANPPGQVWPNGGGWVANGATVASTVYVGPHAAILGGTVQGNAIVTDNATVWNGSVSGSAVIGALTQLDGNLTVSGSAQIKVVKQAQTLLGASIVSGTAQYLGDLEEYVDLNVGQGVFYGYQNDSTIGVAANGADFTTPPVEVTAPLPVPTGSAAQSIAFAAIANQSVGGTLALSATASSGLAVSYASPTPSVCTVSGSSASVIAAGTCTITALQPGNATWAPAPPVTISFSVSQTAQTITFATPPSTSVDSAFVMTATATSHLVITYTSATPAVCTVYGPVADLLTVGTCTITATQPGNAAYAAAAPVTISFSVVPAPNFSLLIPVTDVYLPIGGSVSAPIQITTAAGFTTPINMTTSSEPAGVSISVTPSPVTGTAASAVTNGTIAISAAAGLSVQTVLLDVYGTAGSVVRSAVLSVHIGSQPPLAQTITFDAVPSLTVGSSAALAATASSGLPVTFGSPTPLICSVSGATVTGIASGVCTLVASQTGNAVYAPAPLVTIHVNITQEPQTISFNTPAQQAAGGLFALTATASSGLNVTYASSSPTICTISGASASLVGIGNCTITATQSGDTSYAAAAPVTATFPVAIGTETITFSAIATQYVGTVLTLTATASSGLPISYTASPAGVCTVSGNSLSIIGAGTCTVAASQPGNALVSSAQPVSVTFTVILVPQSITFPVISPQLIGATVTLGATASSGLPVTYASATATCRVTGNTVTPLASGSCTIAATQPGNTTYAAAPSITVTFTVLKSQTITFNTISTETAGVTLALTATASSGLAVTYASSATSVCTVSGSTVTLLTGGTCTITASQSGNAVYAPAAAVSQSFTVVSPESFRLSVSTANYSLAPGAGGTVTVTAAPVNGFTGTVTFTANGTPAGESYTFLQNGPLSAILVMYNPGNVATGKYTVTIKGTSGTISATTTFTLVVD